MVKRLPFKIFQEIYSKAPRVSVELVVKTPKGLLLTLRDIEPFKGEWHIPGGTILFGESIEEALKRIAQDELGATILSHKFLGIIEWLPTPKNKWHDYSLAYLVELDRETFKLNEQAKDYKFFKSLPENTIKEFREFITSQKLLK